MGLTTSIINSCLRCNDSNLASHEFLITFIAAKLQRPGVLVTTITKLAEPPFNFSYQNHKSKTFYRRITFCVFESWNSIWKTQTIQSEYFDIQVHMLRIEENTERNFSILDVLGRNFIKNQNKRISFTLSKIN